MGKIVTVDQNSPASCVVDQAVVLARAGGVLIVPTDSVYGIGAAAIAGNPGHERIFEIKRRQRCHGLLDPRRMLSATLNMFPHGPARLSTPIGRAL